MLTSSFWHSVYMWMYHNWTSRVVQTMAVKTENCIDGHVITFNANILIWHHINFLPCHALRNPFGRVNQIPVRRWANKPPGWPDKFLADATKIQLELSFPTEFFRYINQKSVRSAKKSICPDPNRDLADSTKRIYQCVDVAGSSNVFSVHNLYFYFTSRAFTPANCIREVSRFLPRSDTRAYRRIKLQT